MASQSESIRRPRSLRWRVAATALFTVAAIAVITATVQLANDQVLSWLTAHKSRIVAAEIGFFGVLITELFAAVVIRLFERAGSLQVGVGVRAVLRTVCYVVVAFSAQNLVANAFAGVFLAIAHPFRLGEEITVMGLTGRVVDIRVMHTQLDLGDRIALVPSNTMMAQAIQRRARKTRMDWEFEDDNTLE